jgi:hypothetical protein
MSGELGRHALAEAHRLSPADRAAVLIEWAPSLDASLIGQALQVALAIKSIRDRNEAIYALAPRLLPADLEEALRATREIDDESIRLAFLLSLRPHVEASLRDEIMSRAVQFARLQELPVRALSMIAGDLDGDALDQAMNLAEQSEDEYGRMMFIEALAPHLQTALNERALHAALDIPSQGLRAQALQALAPRLHGTLLDRLVDAAHKMTPVAPRELMLALAPQLGAEARGALIRDVLAFVQLQLSRASFDSMEASRLMIATTPFLEADQVDDILRMQWVPAVNMTEARIVNESLRAEVLAALAPRLSAVQVHDVLEIALASSHEPAKVTLLAGLAPYLSREQLEQVAATSEDFDYQARAQTLATVGPLLSDVRSQAILTDALEAAENIYNEGERCHALESLADVLPRELLPRCLEVALGIKQARYRAKALVSLVPHAPNPDAAQRLARIAIADHIYEDLRDQARPELLRFGLDDALLTPRSLDPTTLDAMARVTFEIGTEWSWL